MVLPFIGHLFYKTYVSGGSSSDGFCIKRKGECIAKSEDFNPAGNKEWSRALAKRYVLIFAIVYWLLIICFCSLTRFTENPSWLKTLWCLGMTLSIAPVSVLISLQLTCRQEKEFREYHAIEHKVAILLGGILEPTLENLKKMPKTSIFCGSAWITFFFSLPFLFSSMLFLECGRLEFLDHLNFLRITLEVIAIYSIFFLPFFSQLLFFVKEPRESLLLEGLEVARKAQEAIKSAP